MKTTSFGKRGRIIESKFIAKFQNELFLLSRVLRNAFLVRRRWMQRPRRIPVSKRSGTQPQMAHCNPERSALKGFFVIFGWAREGYVEAFQVITSLPLTF